MDAYTAALERHLIEVAPQAAQHLVDTVYFGGGTPSYLGEKRLVKLLKAVKKHYRIAPHAEITLEANPDSAGDWKALRALRRAGFNRISLGVQSTDDVCLRALGRIHTWQQVQEAVAACRRAKFPDVSLDLIYGLPGQTMASLKETLTRLCCTGIEHLSVYGLIVEDGTPLQKMTEAGKIILPDEDEAADMYEFVQEFLKMQGFERYEISNYARGKAYSRHNLVYWHYYPYAAFGAGACGFNGSARFTAAAEVQDYIQLIQSGGQIYDKEELPVPVQFEEFMFMNLRKKSGVSLNEAKQRFGIAVMEKYGAEMKPYIEHNLLSFDKERQKMCLTEAGMEVGNRIFEIFVTD